MLYKDLSLPAQTAYAQLAEATLAADLSRSIADLYSWLPGPPVELQKRSPVLLIH